jgi:hypothetical protein
MGRKKLPKSLTRHHLHPKSRGGTNKASNISIVPKTAHRAFNLLFGGNATPQQIANTLNNVWISKEYKFVVERRRPDLKW